MDENTSNKSVFIFREKNNQLLISNNGKIEKGNWDYLGNNSLLIDRKDGSFLFKHGFIDDCVLALKVDGKEEYALLVNEHKFENSLKSLDGILKFLNEKYVEQKEQHIISIPETDMAQGNSVNSLSVNDFSISIDDVIIPQEIRKNIQFDIPFLLYSIEEIDYYIKFFKSKHYPFYAALILDKRKIELSSKLKQKLLMVAKRDFEALTINDVLNTIANNL
ncbi:hypothetical protein A9Q87_04525 [Flavobacteriales bacterium 34_180_T64]|nr:hypothetical protein A9Q87_04525 [Flavobacteriales bacterium 34_180_T64]